MTILVHFKNSRKIPESVYEAHAEGCDWWEDDFSIKVTRDCGKAKSQNGQNQKGSVKGGQTS